MHLLIDYEKQEQFYGNYWWYIVCEAEAHQQYRTQTKTVDAVIT